jgi:hypothetical protein
MNHRLHCILVELSMEVRSHRNVTVIEFGTAACVNASMDRSESYSIEIVHCRETRVQLPSQLDHFILSDAGLLSSLMKAFSIGHPLAD